MASHKVIVQEAPPKLRPLTHSGAYWWQSVCHSCGWSSVVSTNKATVTVQGQAHRRAPHRYTAALSDPE